MAEILEVVGHDDSEAGIVGKPRSPFKSMTQAVSAVSSVWEVQLLRRGEFDDDH